MLVADNRMRYLMEKDVVDLLHGDGLGLHHVPAEGDALAPKVAVASAPNSPVEFEVPSFQSVFAKERNGPNVNFTLTAQVGNVHFLNSQLANLPIHNLPIHKFTTCQFTSC